MCIRGLQPEVHACRADRSLGSAAFWEYRIGCRSVEHEGSILLFGIDVDLNPIRAGEASVPEEARYASAYNRIERRPRSASRPVPEGNRGADDWLCRLTIQDGDRRWRDRCGG